MSTPGKVVRLEAGLILPDSARKQAVKPWSAPWKGRRVARRMLVTSLKRSGAFKRGVSSNHLPEVCRFKLFPIMTLPGRRYAEDPAMNCRRRRQGNGPDLKPGPL